MEFSKEIVSFIKEQMELEKHTEKCISVFEKYIDIYQTTAQKPADQYTKKLVCKIEVFDEFSMKPSFITFPNLGNYGQILPNQDHAFFNEPQFLSYKKQIHIGIQIAKKLDEANNIIKDVSKYSEDDYYDIASEIDNLFEKNIEHWLCENWTKANSNKSTHYPLYFFYHDYLDNSLNLLDKKHYNLEEIATTYE